MHSVGGAIDVTLTNVADAPVLSARCDAEMQCGGMILLECACSVAVHGNLHQQSGTHNHRDGNAPAPKKR